MEELREPIEELITIGESDRVEFTISKNDTNKFCKAICAFSNNFSNDGKSGYLILGIDDKSLMVPDYFQVTDELQKNIAQIKNDGNILPLPDYIMYKELFHGRDILVIKVTPHPLPPLRYKGVVYIRTGPTSNKATSLDEKVLTERGEAHFKTYDLKPCFGANFNTEININLFKEDFLRNALDTETYEENGRDIKVQMASFKFFNLEKELPTNSGILIFGTNVLITHPGAYIQYVRFDGNEMTDDVLNEKVFNSNLVEDVRNVFSLIDSIIVTKKIHFGDTLMSDVQYDYPNKVIREFLLNSVIHRNYESTVPIKFYHFDNFIKIENPGGLYGESQSNFPFQNAYRNPNIANTFKIYNYVEKFGTGIQKALLRLAKNGNNPPEFSKNEYVFSVKIESVFQNENN